MSERILIIDDDPDIVQFVRVNLELEGYRVDVLALGGLEDLFDATRDLESSFLINGSLVPSVEPAVLGDHLGGRLGHLVVAFHGATTTDEDLIVLADLTLDARPGVAHVAHAGLTRYGTMGAGGWLFGTRAQTFHRAESAI